ncbi:MAG: 1-acyl-sn-glycerol-3-phosphate acyltransferase [Actinobacteria bacterium]|nr:1-acyl-sn-glycerol-3-phosphate acyltransferase [Actinomycetota bacterium]
MPSLRRDLEQVARGWRWTRQPLVPTTAEPHAPPRETRYFSTAWARTRPVSSIRDALQRFALKPLVWSQVRPRVHGLDRLEGLEGPVVLAGNHASHLDAPLILCSLPHEWRRRTATAAASDYFFDAWWRATGTTLVFNTFPVDRGRGRLTDTPGELLDDGWNLLIFPEGTRSDDGWVHRFRRGASFLCVQHQVPAVPFAVRGTFAAMPRGRGWPRPGRPAVSLRFGPPLSPAEGEAFRSFNQRLEAAVARLLDEDRSTWWESLRRAADDATPPAGGPDHARWRRVWASSEPLPDGRRRVFRR